VCIARALATQELILAVKGIVRSNVLMEGGEEEEGKGHRAKAVGEGIRIIEWFNAKVAGGRIEVIWE
jgi:hypothetical protein